MAHSFLLLGFAVVFSLFALFVWREQARDEREEQHRQVAGRIGFLVGAGLLVAGIIIQSLRHSLDSWLLITLTGMIVGKLAGRWYSALRN